MRSSFELHTNFIWTSREFHMNKFDLISYEIHKKFIWTPYEARMKLKINLYVVQTKFMWGYGYMASYGLHMNEPPGPSYPLGSIWGCLVLVHRAKSWYRIKLVVQYLRTNIVMLEPFDMHKYGISKLCSCQSIPISTQWWTLHELWWGFQSVNFFVSKIFDLAKVHVRLFQSHSYLTGATATELRWHLSSMNLIFHS